MPQSPFDRLLLGLSLAVPDGADRRDSLVPTLLSSRIDLHPHQVEAAIFALTRPFGRGAILADEVGLGKTVEAGLVIAQRLAEGAERILILVPATLRVQWQAELRRFFGIQARIVDLKTLRRERGHHGTRGVHLCSLSFFSNDTNPADFREADWDLVVIDEAHRLRGVARPGARRARRLRSLLRGKPKLLLTATPLQNSLLELHGLVSFVDDKLLGAEPAFRSRFLKDTRGRELKHGDELRARLATVLIRTLRRQVLDSIRFTNRMSLLYDFEPLPAERELYEGVSDYLMRARSVALAFGNREFLLLAYRKILASSTFAVRATLEKLVLTVEERLASRAPALPFEAAEVLGVEALDEDGEEPEKAELSLEGWSRSELEEELRRLRGYIALAASIDRNAKGDRLLGALGDVFRSAREKGWPEKAVVFTESRRTQEYLKRLLEPHYPGRVILFHGGSGDSLERDRLVTRFRDEGQVLVATEAGAEGLNLQFCNVVVNYDLPWNPQRIEQRIGRCHRYGQPLDVLVVNFLNSANAADRRLHQLLSLKLHLFDGVFGSSDEVLGALESGVDFERQVLRIYQSCRTAAEIDRAFDHLQGSIEELSSRRLAEARASLIDHFDEEVRARLAVRRSVTLEELKGVEARVRALVLGSASAAEPEPGGEVWRIELPPEVVLHVPSDALATRVRFTPGADASVLGPRHPLVAALVEHVLASEGPSRVHELVVPVRDALVALRGRRGYWLVYRARLGGVARREELLDLAMLEGDTAPLGAEEMEALRASARDHVGYSALGCPEPLRKAIETTLRAVLMEREDVARAETEQAVAEERRRLRRFAEEAQAVAEQQVERSRQALERARERLAELDRAAGEARPGRREAASIVDLLEGQHRHEERLAAEDARRRERDIDATLAELRVGCAVNGRLSLAGAARLWLV